MSTYSTPNPQAHEIARKQLLLHLGVQVCLRAGVVPHTRFTPEEIASGTHPQVEALLEEASRLAATLRALTDKIQGDEA